MSKLSKFSIEGWDYYQYAYAVKWYKDRFGDPAGIDEARSAYEKENATAPPKLEDFYDLDLTSILVKKMLGNLLGQRTFEINLMSEKEPKNGN